MTVRGGAGWPSADFIKLINLCKNLCTFTGHIFVVYVYSLYIVQCAGHIWVSFARTGICPGFILLRRKEKRKKQLLRPNGVSYSLNFCVNKFFLGSKMHFFLGQNQQLIEIFRNI